MKRYTIDPLTFSEKSKSPLICFEIIKDQYGIYFKFNTVTECYP